MTAPIHTLLEFESMAMDLDLATDPAAVRQRFGPPPREGLGPLTASGEAWERIAGGQEGFAARAFTPLDLRDLLDGPRIDRDRSPDDRLDQVPPLPPFGGAEFAVARFAPNRFRFRPLPAGRCRFTLTCLDWASETVELDLSTPPQRAVGVVLRRRVE